MSVKQVIRICSFVIILICGLLISCNPSAEAPAPTSTPVPSVATPTPVLPTSLPTLVSPTSRPTPPSGSVVFQNPQGYQVEYIVTVNNEGFEVDELRVYQPRPVEWDAQQDIHLEEVSPPPNNEGVDPLFGNGLYHWQTTAKPARGEAILFILRFTFTAYETLTSIDPDVVQPYDERDPLYTLYTRSERFIEASDPQIVKIANQVAAGETNPYRLAQRFYGYVVDTANYELLGEGLLGAKTLVTTGNGECGDYSALFVALCRAQGIPARPVVGYWAVSGIEQTHVWAEFYVEPFGWIPVDPTVGQSELDKRDYYFGNMDNQRVILNKGYNIPLYPPGPDEYIAPFLQVPLWWYWGSSGDANSVSMERTNWTVTSFP